MPSEEDTEHYFVISQTMTKIKPIPPASQTKTLPLSPRIERFWSKLKLVF